MVLTAAVEEDLRVRNEIRYIRSAGHEVAVLVPGTGSVRTHEEGFQIVPSGIRPKESDLLFGTANVFPFYRLRWSRAVKAFIRAHGVELLHAHDLFTGGFSAEAAKSAGIPCIADLHENFPAAVKSYAWVKKFPQSLFAHPEKWKTKEKAILEGTDGLILLSESYAEELYSEYPSLREKPVAVYPNVPDTDLLLSYPIREVPFRKSGFCLLYFGAVGKRRGLHTAAEAVRKLKARGKDCTLLVIGHVHKNEQAWFEKEVCGPGVTHIPWTDISLLRSWLQVCDVCISPLVKNAQHDSGVANKIFQYMLYEKPILVSNCTPQQALAEGCACGLSHRSEDPDDFAEKVEAMMADPEALRKMGENGKRAVTERYNLATAGRAITELYETVRKNF